jgi:hypothetical protein
MSDFLPSLAESTNLKCEYCDKTYGSRQGLQKHLESVHMQLAHRCLECDLPFTSRSDSVGSFCLRIFGDDEQFIASSHASCSREVLHVIVPSLFKCLQQHREQRRNNELRNDDDERRRRRRHRWRIGDAVSDDFDRHHLVVGCQRRLLRARELVCFRRISANIGIHFDAARN